jgi:hypothetical protein
MIDVIISRITRQMGLIKINEIIYCIEDDCSTSAKWEMPWNTMPKY